MRTNDIGGFRPVNAQSSTTCPSRVQGRDKAATACRTTAPGQSKARLKGQAVKQPGFRALPSGAKAVLEALWEMADTPRGRDPWVHGRAKVKTIAHYSGLSGRQVQRWLGRLRVVETGQDAPAGHLGGWIDTHVVAGRFLAFTVYAEPSQSTAETVIEDIKVLSEPTPMSEEVGHPRPTDIPPVLSTFTTTKATANAKALPEAEPDHGGGGDRAGSQNRTTAAPDRDRVRRFLADAGCRPGDVDRLTYAVMQEPDGPARLSKTWDTLKSSINVIDPMACLVKRIRNGTLDELDKADRQREELHLHAEEISRRGYATLNDWMADMTARLEDAPGVRIPIPLENLLGLNGTDAQSTQLDKVKAMPSERRLRWMASVESAMSECLSAASDGTTVAA